MPYCLLFFLLLITLPLSSSSSSSFPYDVKYYIDCGSPTDTVDSLNTTWISDRYFSGGVATVVSEPLHFKFPQEKTLRYFPLSAGKKNCYSVPVPSGRYFLRTFTVYDNYDGKSHPPSFDVSVEGTTVFSWRAPWQENLPRDGAYADLLATVGDGVADVCFYSLATDPPVVGSLEVLQVDPASYDPAYDLLVNYGRISCGSEHQWGPGFTNDSDPFGRTWQQDNDFRGAASSFKTLGSVRPIGNSGRAPNYFPEKLYQTAVTGTGPLEYVLSVDAKMDYLLYFHFAEIDASVTRRGQRVFDVVVNDKSVNRIDIFAQVGGFAAYDWSYMVQNLTSTSINIKFVPSVGQPLVSGIENYAIVPRDASTLPDQVAAMKALKDSLRVPDRMGWNGDPCAPTNWDAWEGVTCRPKNGSALVISQIDLGSQGLKGYLGEQISLLTDLVSLNLSSNSLVGTLPAGLGHKSLTNLDLSNNLFTGPIPDSLTTSSLHLVRLNNNQLEGRVPEKLYAIGMHGGAINLSENKGLCGVPSLPDCSLLWENGHLSTGGKVGIGISCLVVFCLLLLLIYVCCIRRGRNDYDFAPTHDLTSMAAKRNRYHRQKSLMVLEMESQHAKGLSSPTGPH